MPAYEFENKRHGVRVILVMPVDRRPRRITLTRKTIPSGLTVGTGARPEPMGEKIRRGYYHLEERGKLSDKNPNYLPVSKIKEALALPDAD